MCVAGLHASPGCGHRWYELVRPCQPSNHLANCSARLQLEGWERRLDVCPFCHPGSETPIHESTHRLLFGTGAVSSATPASPDIPGMTRMYRSSSGGTTLSSLSRRSSSSSGSAQDGTSNDRRNREMNDRLVLYLTTDPHEVLPSARKNYPTYSSSTISNSVSASSASSIIGRDDVAMGSEVNSIYSASGTVSRGWKKGVRLGKGLFKT